MGANVHNKTIRVGRKISGVFLRSVYVNDENDMKQDPLDSVYVEIFFLLIMLVINSF